MEKKKKLLIKVLTQLIPYWDLATGFLVLVKETTDDVFMEALLSLIKKQMVAIKDKKKKQAILHQIENIKKIESKRKRNIKQDQEDADKLLNDLLYDKA